MIEVGNYEKRMVTELNQEIFHKAKNIMEEGCNLSHIGWTGLGDLVDWLEENYTLEKKDGGEG